MGYEKPSITVVGSVSELTLGNNGRGKGRGRGNGRGNGHGNGHGGAS